MYWAFAFNMRNPPLRTTEFSRGPPYFALRILWGIGKFTTEFSGVHRILLSEFFGVYGNSLRNSLGYTVFELVCNFKFLIICLHDLYFVNCQSYLETAEISFACSDLGGHLQGPAFGPS